MQLVILWFLESALSAVRLETALGLLPVARLVSESRVTR
jgi:hypothetical protein